MYLRNKSGFSPGNASRLVCLALLWILLGQSLNALAVTGVTLLVGEPSVAANEFIEQLRVELAQTSNAKLPLNVLSLDKLSADKLSINTPTGDDSLVLAVGVQALSRASQLDSRVPVLGVLVPRPSYEKILQDSKRNPRNFSAIVLDQPFFRQLALIKIILPGTTSISALLGPTSRDSLAELKRAANQQGLALQQANVEVASQLLPRLKQILETSSVLLAVPDPLVYSRESVQPILLTTYRYQVPVIGFSQAYVRAGALAAVYSTPRQIARQIVEELMLFDSRPRNGFNAVQYPKYFSVDVNRQVAHSLGIELGDENTLSETLLRMERSMR
ncbi:MAG TPA: ABC transporter substrate binding protein [Methylophilaceae bacterium]|nr:ABC transporter substrate binding protein [Methylophilaceae bacterium]